MATRNTHAFFVTGMMVIVFSIFVRVLQVWVMKSDSMNEVELAAWLSFGEVVKNFFGNYKEIVNNMLGNFRILGINMSIKVHFLHSHLDWFAENLGDVSDEQGKRFHQNIKTMEERYQGRWDIKVMIDYCWNLKRDKPDSEHSGKSWKRKFSTH